MSHLTWVTCSPCHFMYLVKYEIVRCIFQTVRYKRIHCIRVHCTLYKYICMRCMSYIVLVLNASVHHLPECLRGIDAQVLEGCVLHNSECTSQVNIDYSSAEDGGRVRRGACFHYGRFVVSLRTVAMARTELAYWVVIH